MSRRNVYIYDAGELADVLKMSSSSASVSHSALSYRAGPRSSPFSKRKRKMVTKGFRYINSGSSHERLNMQKPKFRLDMLQVRVYDMQSCAVGVS